jgi:hypothetical protein
MNRIIAVFALAVLIIVSAVQGRRDAAEKQRHVIYDEASWFVG